MNRKTLWLAAMLCIAIFPLLHAQQVTISGRIFSAESGEALPGAQVFLALQQKGAVTDSEGSFSFTAAGGEDTLKAFLSEYAVLSIPLNISADTSIEIHLSPAEAELETVVIEGNTDREKLDDPQMGKQELDIIDIKALPALFGEPDVMRAIQMLPGIQNGSEGSTGFFVRGGSTDQNLILVDKVPVYNASHMFGLFSVFNPEAISNVTAYTGGFPAQYGGRLSSVLSIEQRRGKDHFTVSGGLGLISSRLTVEGPVGKKANYMISARRTYFELITRRINASYDGVDEFEKIPDYWFYDLNGRFDWDLNSKNKLWMSAYNGRDRIVINGIGSVFFRYLGEWSNTTAAVGWDHFLNSKRQGSLTFYHTGFYYLITNTTDDYELMIRSRVRDFGMKYDISDFSWKNHEIKTGVQYTWHQFRPQGINSEAVDLGISYDDDPLVQSHEAGVYITDDWKISSRWRAEYGLRYSLYAQGDKVYHGPEPRLSLRYKVNEDISLKGAYTRMYQYIHLISNSTINLPTDIWYPATARTPGQRSDLISTGITTLFLKDKFMFSTEAYYKWMDNQVEFREGAEIFLNPDYEEDFTAGRGWSYGAEFLLRKRSGKITGMIGYMLSWTYRQFEQKNFGEPYPAKFDRRHDISTTLSWDISPRAKLTAAWVFGSGTTATIPVARYYIKDLFSSDGYIVNVFSDKNSYRIPPFHHLDLGFTWKFQPKWGSSDLTLSIYNVYSRRNIFWVHMERVKGTGGITTKYIPRKVSLFPIIPSLTWNFTFGKK